MLAGTNISYGQKKDLEYIYDKPFFSDTHQMLWKGHE